MIQYRNGKFICADRIALKLPNNVFLDFNPPVVPMEGMIFYSPDERITIDVDLVETDRDALSFLLNADEECKTVRILQPLRHVTIGTMEGYGMTYALSREVYEEYALTVPGEESALFVICLTQEVGEESDPADYARLQDELLAGIELV